MEWTKIKPKHFLYTDLSLGNIGCLTVLLCLTAHLERLPTKKERVKHTHIRALRSLEEALKKQSYPDDEVVMKQSCPDDEVVMKQSCPDDEVVMKQGRSIDEVLMKVLEDFNKVEHKRKLNAKHQKTYREKHKALKGDSKPLHKATDKRREDKIREEKRREEYKNIANNSSEKSLKRREQSSVKSDTKGSAKERQTAIIEHYYKLSRITNKAQQSALWARCAKSAKILLEYAGGDVQKVLDILTRADKHYLRQNLSWRIETVVKNWHEIEKGVKCEHDDVS